MIPRRKVRFYKGEWKDILKTIIAAKAGDGEYIKLFEEKFARYIDSRFAIGTCSGRNAMDLLLDSLKLEQGSEVILPVNTLEDFIPLMIRKGLAPILVDIEKDSFNIDPDLIEDKITDKTKVIIINHRYGLSADIERVMSIAQKHNLRVIEDCAHALGTRYKGKKVGGFGDASFFVFGATKPINTFGGGIIATNNAEIASFVKKRIIQYNIDSKKLLAKIALTCIEELIIRSPLYILLSKLFMFESTTKVVVHSSLGLHQKIRPDYSRFNNLQALLALRQLDGLDERNRKRCMIAKGFIKNLPEGVKVQTSQFIEGHIFYYFVVRFLNAIDYIEILRKNLVLQGIDVGVKEEFIDNSARFIGKEDGYPVMKGIFNTSLQLPMYDNLTESEIHTICCRLSHILS